MFFDGPRRREAAEEGCSLTNYLEGLIERDAEKEAAIKPLAWPLVRYFHFQAIKLSVNANAYQ